MVQDRGSRAREISGWKGNREEEGGDREGGKKGIWREGERDACKLTEGLLLEESWSAINEQMPE